MDSNPPLPPDCLSPSTPAFNPLEVHPATDLNPPLPSIPISPTTGHFDPPELHRALSVSTMHRQQNTTQERKNRQAQAARERENHQYRKIQDCLVSFGWATGRIQSGYNAFVERMSQDSIDDTQQTLSKRYMSNAMQTLLKHEKPPTLDAVCDNMALLAKILPLFIAEEKLAKFQLELRAANWGAYKNDRETPDFDDLALLLEYADDDSRSFLEKKVAEKAERDYRDP